MHIHIPKTRKNMLIAIFEFKIFSLVANLKTSLTQRDKKETYQMQGSKFYYINKSSDLCSNKLHTLGFQQVQLISLSNILQTS